MNNITKMRRFTLLVCFLLFQALLFTANAQCGNVIISAISTPATCYGNGTITVTVGGEDVGNLRLSNAEFRLTPISGGNSVDWTPTWSGTGVTKIYNQAVSGVYKLEMRAFCQVSNNWTTQQIATNVTVEGTYTPMEFSAVMSRKSMNCKPTGQITMNFSGGRPPYNVTFAAPGYTGQTSFSTSSALLTVDNVPQGNYSITAKDACNYSIFKTVTVAPLANDVVQTLYLYMARPTGSTDCKSIIPQSSNNVSDPDEQYYWQNSAIYYEYAYLVNGIGSKNWAALPNNDKRPVFVLPDTYATFCASDGNIVSYIRPKGCTTEKSVQHDLSSYVCPNPTSRIFNVSSLSGSECTTAKLSFTIPYYYGLCYPADWKITASATPNTIIASGTLTNGGTISDATISQEYNRNTEYTITLTETGGRVLTYPWKPEKEPLLYGSYAYTNGYYCIGNESSHPVGSSYISLYTSPSENILPGTVIKYVSGPQALGMGSIGTAYTIPPGRNSTNFYPTGVAPYTNVTYPLPILTPGDYRFEITPPCGDIYSRTITKEPNYRVQTITYTTEQTCNGLKVIPTGGLQLVDAAGQTTNVSAYFRIMSKPAGVSINPNYVVQGGELVLPIPGTYKIGMMVPGQQSNNGCTIGSIDIVYNQSSLYINPEMTSAYVCEGSTAGRIRVQAINGVAPYTYTVTSVSPTPAITPQSNLTGVFPSIGIAGGIYNIEVKDACNTSFSIQVTMLDLANANIAYTVDAGDGLGKFYEKTEIQINSVALGNTTYSWTGPNGFTSTEQRPRPIAVYPASSGTYTVTVIPEGCPQPITRELEIEVLTRAIILDPCRTYSIRYELPQIYTDTKAKLEWSTPSDTTRRLIPTCNLSYGDKCIESLDTINDSCGLKNNLPAQIDICPGGKSVTLDATVKVPASYKWSGGSSNKIITVETPGVYTVVITPNNGCSAITQNVTVGSVGASCFGDDAGSDVMNLCAGEAMQLSVPGCGKDYQWSPVDYLSNDTIANPVATPPSSTSYNVAITTAGGCKINRTVYVNVNAPFELNTEKLNDKIYCKGDKVPLDVSGADGYRWYPKDGLSCYDCSAPQHTVTGNKTYTVTGIKNGCTVSKAINITQYPDEIYFDYTKNGCNISFKASEEKGYKNYTWTFGDGEQGTGKTTTHPYNSHGTYYVCVEATNNCGVRISRCMHITITPDECACQLQDCP